MRQGLRQDSPCAERRFRVRPTPVVPGSRSTSKRVQPRQSLRFQLPGRLFQLSTFQRFSADARQVWSVWSARAATRKCARDRKAKSERRSCQASARDFDLKSTRLFRHMLVFDLFLSSLRNHGEGSGRKTEGRKRGRCVWGGGISHTQPPPYETYQRGDIQSG